MSTVQSADGTAIAFDRSGHGPALVLVIGAFSDRSATKAVAAGLGSRFTVYEFDRRVAVTAATQRPTRSKLAAVPNGQVRALEGQGHRAADEVLIPVLVGFSPEHGRGVDSGQAPIVLGVGGEQRNEIRLAVLRHRYGPS